MSVTPTFPRRSCRPTPRRQPSPSPTLRPIKRRALPETRAQQVTVLVPASPTTAPWPIRKTAANFRSPMPLPTRSPPSRRSAPWIVPLLRRVRWGGHSVRDRRRCRSGCRGTGAACRDARQPIARHADEPRRDRGCFDAGRAASGHRIAQRIFGRSARRRSPRRRSARPLDVVRAARLDSMPGTIGNAGRAPDHLGTRRLDGGHQRLPPAQKTCTGGEPTVEWAWLPRRGLSRRRSPIVSPTRHRPRRPFGPHPTAPMPPCCLRLRRGGPRERTASSARAEAALRVAGVDRLGHTAVLRETPAIAQAVDSIVVTPGWHEDIARSSRNLFSLRATTAEIRLNPADLGPIGVTISYTDDQARVTITAAQPATEEALPHLKEMWPSRASRWVRLQVRDRRGADVAVVRHRSQARIPTSRHDAPGAGPPHRRPHWVPRATRLIRHLRRDAHSLRIGWFSTAYWHDSFRLTPTIIASTCSQPPQPMATAKPPAK